VGDDSRLGSCRPAVVLSNRANSSAVEDVKVVGALDTQYQAAVEKCDAATMEHILADDFILVTGTGKTYTKSIYSKSTERRNHLQESEGHGKDSPRLGQYGSRYRHAMGARHGRREAFRLPTLVQRHLCPQSHGMALCIWPSFIAPAEGPMKNPRIDHFRAGKEDTGSYVAGARVEEDSVPIFLVVSNSLAMPIPAIAHAIFCYDHALRLAVLD